MSLRTRLLAGMAFIALVLVAVAATITITTRAHLMDQVDARLEGFGGLPPDQDDHHGPSGSDDQASPSEERAETGSPNRISDVYQGFVGSDGSVGHMVRPVRRWRRDRPPGSRRHRSSRVGPVVFDCRRDRQQ